MNYLKLVETYVTKYYKEFCDEKFTYHNLSHVKNVVKTAEKIGAGCQLDMHEVELLKISAWFHDIGHLINKEDHELKSVKMAKYFLEQINYPTNKIDSVTKCIMATDLNIEPTNILEMIIKDADLSHLGSSKYIEYGDNLFEENINRKICSPDYFGWIQSSINFFNKHQYFTSYAKNLYEKQKAINLEILNLMIYESSLIPNVK